MFSVSEYNFAYYLIYKNRAAYFTNTYWFAQYYFAYIIYMCIYTHTYEYTYMYSINSPVYYDVRDSIRIHMYMTILSLIYTYIYEYMYMYMYIYIYTHIHTHIQILIFYECIVHAQYLHVQRRSPRHFLYKVLHVHRQFSPLSSDWSRVKRRSPRRQRYVVGCISANRVLLTISSMHWRATGPLQWWPVSPGTHHCWIQFCAGPQVLEYIAGVWARCPIPATEYAAAGCTAMKMDSNATGTHP